MQIMHAYIHKCIHIYTIHSYIDTCVHTYTHTYYIHNMHAYIQITPTDYTDRSRTNILTYTNPKRICIYTPHTEHKSFLGKAESNR